MIELTITELAYRLKFVNDDFEKLHKYWQQAREEISDKLNNRSNLING